MSFNLKGREFTLEDVKELNEYLANNGNRVRVDIESNAGVMCSDTERQEEFNQSSTVICVSEWCIGTVEENGEEKEETRWWHHKAFPESRMKEAFERAIWQNDKYLAFMRKLGVN